MFKGTLGNYVELESHKLLEQGNFGFTFATTKPDGLLLLSTFLTQSNPDKHAREVKPNSLMLSENSNLDEVIRGIINYNLSAPRTTTPWQSRTAT